MHLLLFSCRANVYRVLNFLPIRLHINSIHLNEMSKGITTNLGWVRGSDRSGNLKFIVTLPPSPSSVWICPCYNTGFSKRNENPKPKLWGRSGNRFIFIFCMKRLKIFCITMHQLGFRGFFSVSCLLTISAQRLKLTQVISLEQTLRTPHLHMQYRWHREFPNLSRYPRKPLDFSQLL